MTDVPAIPTPPAPPPTPPPAPAPTPSPPSPPPPAPASGVDENNPEQLRTALAAERRQREAAERAAKQHQGELDKLRQASMSDQEKAIENAKREATTEAHKSFNRRVFAAEVRVAVAGRVVDSTLFENPDVTLHLLGFQDVPTLSNGDVDDAAIKKAVDDFLKNKPYLLGGGQQQPPASPPRFPSANGGPQGAGTQKNPEEMSMEEYMKWREENDPRSQRRRARLGG